MNERYLSRAKTKGHPDMPDGQWVQGFYMHCYEQNRDYILTGETKLYENLYHSHLPNRGFEWILIDPSTIGQCTGLKDKNSKLIFEGDIVRYTQDYYGDNSDMNNWDTAVVVWEGEFNYPAFDLNHHSFDSNAFSELLSIGARIEIVGNIHDHPELLEEAT